MKICFKGYCWWYTPLKKTNKKHYKKGQVFLLKWKYDRLLNLNPIASKEHKIKPTAFSKCDLAKSVFFVCVNKICPNWRCVRASIFCEGLKLKIDWRQCIHRRIFGGFEVLKFSARPTSEAYHGSDFGTDAILSIFVDFSAMLLQENKHYSLPHWISIWLENIFISLKIKQINNC